MDTLIFEKQNGVAKITMNRPDKYNAVTQELAFAFQKALDECASDKSIRAIVITGNGRAFCAGQDLAEATDENGIELESIVSDHYNPIIKKIVSLEKPVIAAINGVAAGAGANIALCCDITIAKKSASFIQAFSKIGLIPDSGGTYFLPRIIGHQKASALMMLGDKISATQAEDLGMIYKVVENDVFAATVDRIANTLANMPTKGLALTKKALQQTWSNDLNTQLDVEHAYQKEAGNSHDYREGTAAFLEKRRPKFIGE